MTQQNKTLDNFDLNNFQENIKSINTELDMHNKLQITMQEGLNDLRLSVKSLYASTAFPLRAPDNLNVNKSLQFVNNVECLLNEKLNVQVTPDKVNGTNVVDSDFVKRSMQIVDVNIYTFTISKSDGMMNDMHKKQFKFKILVRIQGNTEEIKPVNNNVFDGVPPMKRSAIFYISGIDRKSMQSGILRYLEMINVKKHNLQ